MSAHLGAASPAVCAARNAFTARLRSTVGGVSAIWTRHALRRLGVPSPRGLCGGVRLRRNQGGMAARPPRASWRVHDCPRAGRRRVAARDASCSRPTRRDDVRHRSDKSRAVVEHGHTAREVSAVPGRDRPGRDRPPAGTCPRARRLTYRRRQRLTKKNGIDILPGSPTAVPRELSAKPAAIDAFRYVDNVRWLQPTRPRTPSPPFGRRAAARRRQGTLQVVDVHQGRGSGPVRVLTGCGHPCGVALREEVARTAPLRRSRRCGRRIGPDRGANAGNPDSPRTPNARSRFPATRSPAAGRGRGGSRRGSTRMPRRHREQALRAEPRHRGTGASAPPPRRRHPDAGPLAARGQPQVPRAPRQAGAARRAARRLRGHRGGGGVGSVADQDHGSAHRGRLGDRRREVVRHIRRRGRGLHRDGKRARGRPDAADAVSGRPLARRDRDRGQPALHAHLPARASGGALHGRRGGRGRGHRRPGRRRGSPARVVHRGAAGNRRPRCRARCGD